jgi:hypothetical protein
MMWLWIAAAICLYAFIGGATFEAAKALDLGPDYCEAGVAAVMWPLAWAAFLLSLIVYLGMRLVAAIMRSPPALEHAVLAKKVARRKQRP